MAVEQSTAIFFKAMETKLKIQYAVCLKPVLRSALFCLPYTIICCKVRDNFDKKVLKI
jgi:hypothetical protein